MLPGREEVIGKEKRIERPESDLLESLIRHVSLLEDYYRRAFERGDERYLGELAGKLRLLVLRGKQNRPLLLDLMERFGSSVMVHLNDPYSTEPITVDEYLDRLAFSVRLDDGPVSFTNREFVATWAQQHGASHEDPAHDRRYAASRTLPVIIFGEHSHKWHIGAITRTILSVAHAFFRELEAKGVLVRIEET